MYSQTYMFQSIDYNLDHSKTGNDGNCSQYFGGKSKLGSFKAKYLPHLKSQCNSFVNSEGYNLFIAVLIILKGYCQPLEKNYLFVKN